MSYTITAPVNFENFVAGSVLDFNADCTLNENIIRDFATNAGGDMLYRDGSVMTNDLTCLTIGSAGDVLCVGAAVAQEDAFTLQSSTAADYSSGAGMPAFYLTVYVQGLPDRYYLWFLTDATEVDPSPMGYVGGFTIDITTANVPMPSAANFAAEVAGAISMIPDVTGAVATNVATAMQDNIGPVNDGIVDAGLAAVVDVVTIEGTTAIPKWAPVAANTAMDSLLIRKTTPDVIPSQLMSTTLVDNWDAPAAIPYHDSGNHFNAMGGGLTTWGATTNAIFVIGCTVQFDHAFNTRGGLRRLQLFNTSTMTVLAETEYQAHADDSVNLTMEIIPQAFELAIGNMIAVRVQQTSGGNVALVSATITAFKYADVTP